MTDDDKFCFAREVLRRVAYRVLLGREMEDAAQATESFPRFENEQEQLLTTLLADLASSPEANLYASRRGFPNYPGSAWVTADHSAGYRVRINMRPGGVSASQVNESFRSIETTTVRSLLRPGQHFADIGARSGWLAMAAAARLGPDGRVVAIEPADGLRAQLARAVADNDFGDRIEIRTADFAFGDDDLETDDMASHDTATADIPFQRGQSLPLAAVMRDQHFDLVALRTGGYEALMIADALELVRRDRPAIMATIDANHLFNRSRLSSSSLIALLTAENYGVHLPDPSGNAGPMRTRSDLPSNLSGTVLFLPRIDH